LCSRIRFQMFDPSFFELIIICVVALLVLGPDRLPGAIKTLGLWIGRLRRSFNNIKREIEQEVGADEIRRQLRNEAIMEKFKNTKSQITNSIESVKSEAESIKKDLDITKGLSDSVAGTQNAAASELESSADPIEKLPTNDPAARTSSSSAAANKAPASSPNSSENSSDNSGSVKQQPDTQSRESSTATGTTETPAKPATTPATPDVKDTGAVKPDNTEK